MIAGFTEDQTDSSKQQNHGKNHYPGSQSFRQNLYKANPQHIRQYHPQKGCLPDQFNHGPYFKICTSPFGLKNLRRESTNFVVSLRG